MTRSLLNLLYLLSGNILVFVINLKRHHVLLNLIQLYDPRTCNNTVTPNGEVILWRYAMPLYAH